MTSKNQTNANFILQVSEQRLLAFQIKCPAQAKVSDIFSKIFIVLFKNKSAASSCDIFVAQNKVNKQMAVKENQSYYMKIDKDKYDQLVNNIPKNQQVNNSPKKQPLKPVRLPSLQKSSSDLNKIQQQKKKKQKQKNLKILEENKRQLQIRKKTESEKKIQQDKKDKQLMNLNSQRQLNQKNRLKESNKIIDSSNVATTPIPPSSSEGCCQLI